jgi:hypothetical protein
LALVPDQKPSRRAGDERATLQDLLQFHRTSIVKKVRGISDDQARSSPVPSGTSLLWLLRHLTYAEAIWVLDRFAGQGASVVPPNRSEPDDTVKAAVAAYKAMWAQVDAVVAEADDLDVLCRANDRRDPTDLRWVLAHLLEETARHAGHADIIRELIDGKTGR